LNSGQGSTSLQVESLLAWAVFLLLPLALLIVILSFPLGAYSVYFGNISNSTAGVVGYLWVGILATPISVPYAATFAVVTVVYAAMFGFALTQGKSIREAVGGALSRDPKEFFTNRGLLAVIAISFFGFTVNAVDSAVVGFGNNISNPFTNFDPLRFFVGLSVAPLTEEFGFRLLIIGTAAVIVSLGRPWKEVGRALWRPSSAYEPSEGRSLAFYVVLAAGVVSVSLFAVVHIPGYGLAKLPEAAYAGVVLVYLYIRYGFHVAVLAHWGIDYLSVAFAYYGQAETYVLFYTDVIFGSVCFFLVAYMGLGRFGRGGFQPGGGSNEPQLGESGGQN
jgi:CAAX prenyl protease-like protein